MNEMLAKYGWSMSGNVVSNSKGKQVFTINYDLPGKYRFYDTAGNLLMSTPDLVRGAETIAFIHEMKKLGTKMEIVLVNEKPAKVYWHSDGSFIIKPL